MKRLEGKVAVVVGCSAERGTGWAIAEGLAADGAKVVVAARSEGPIRELADKISGHAVVCDISVEEQVVNLARVAQETFGPIDIAVNAAGLPVHATIAQATASDIVEGLGVNYTGCVFFIREMAAIMNNGGSIILISSSSASQPVGDYFSYGCAKAAMDCLVRYAAIEFGPRGIRVNSVLPGPIRSEMAGRLFDLPGVDAVYAREIPLGRIGEPADYADVVVWLSGPAFVTGLNIPVSGGNHLTRSPRSDELPPSVYA